MFFAAELSGNNFSRSLFNAFRQKTERLLVSFGSFSFSAVKHFLLKGVERRNMKVLSVNFVTIFQASDATKLNLKRIRKQIVGREKERERRMEERGRKRE